MTETRKLRKVRVGKVVSDKMDKTITVAIEDNVRHPKYGKIIKRTVKFKAHDEQNACGIGDTVRVMAVSNCDEVELFLNGKSLGRKPSDVCETAEWQIEYAPGRISAKAYRNGKCVAKAEQRTAGKPYAVAVYAVYAFQVVYHLQVLAGVWNAISTGIAIFPFAAVLAYAFVPP